MANSPHKTISPSDVRRHLEEGKPCQIIDVREAAEFGAEFIEGSRHMPLSALPEHLSQLEKGKPVFIVCRSGNRARMAAEKLGLSGVEGLHVVEGGLMAWRAEGHPVKTGPSSVWSLERQVRFAAGSLVLAGCTAGAFWHPAGYGLAAFVGAGLVFAAVTDTCGMAMLLARLPWNRKPAPTAPTACRLPKH